VPNGLGFQVGQIRAAAGLGDRDAHRRVRGEQRGQPYQRRPGDGGRWRADGVPGQRRPGRRGALDQQHGAENAQAAGELGVTEPGLPGETADPVAVSGRVVERQHVLAQEALELGSFGPQA
jgi:hypothetical protein